MITIAKEKLGDVEVAIEVRESGEFIATYDDTLYRSSTKTDLLEQLRKAHKRAQAFKPIAVSLLGLIARPADGRSHIFYREDPFIDGPGVVHAKLRGENARQRKGFMFTSEAGGIKFQLYLGDRDSKRQLARRLTTDEERTYMDLQAAVQAAKDQLEAFVDTVSLDPSDAIAAARGGQEE